MKKFALVALAAAVATPAFGATIDFESAGTGNFANGTTIGGVTFGSALGTGFTLDNYGSQGDGISLAVFNDSNGNFVTGSLAGTATSISLDFGNDDPGFTNPGDLATLIVYLGTTQVGTSTVVLNRDDIMNQTISYSGAAFNNFTFAYTDALGAPFTGGGGANTGLIEIIDNINVTAVPEPATWALMIAGFGLVGTAMRRRSVATAHAAA